MVGRSDPDGRVGVWLPSGGSTYTMHGAVNGYKSASMTIEVAEREEMNVGLPLSGGSRSSDDVDARFNDVIDNASVILEGNWGVYRGQRRGEFAIESVPSGA